MNRRERRRTCAHHPNNDPNKIERNRDKNIEDTVYMCPFSLPLSLLFGVRVQSPPASQKFPLSRYLREESRQRRRPLPTRPSRPTPGTWLHRGGRRECTENSENSRERTKSVALYFCVHTNAGTTVWRPWLF